MVYCRLLREKKFINNNNDIKNWVREYFNREKVFNNISILFDWWRKRIKGLLIDYMLKFIEYVCKM